MPRRRPSAVRGDLRARLPRHFFRYPYPPINRLSGACKAHIRRLEHQRFWPGATEKAFWYWADLAHGPLRAIGNPLTSTRCGIPECGCDPGYSRDHLEEVMHALPKKSARELRKLVRDLDSKILRRAKVIRAASPDLPWWRDQL
ncbi:hypothetical protein GCM10010280_59720 [Streptomyces pilosus]|uniref:Uncharacterized protein n=1 Tax=Streptomyces pilosus TaxID=28893 RepID=A0A918C433_9ACTN|nr:hypothetical protein GCM10010280_59720 [Streptomyces pilosus]